MPIQVDSPEFSQFLVEAKVATYAAGDERYQVPALLPGSHQLEYRQADLLYRDIYYGGLNFAGLEIIFQESQAIWSMTYYGGFAEGIDPAQNEGLGDFLKAALRQVPPESPYRGPQDYSEAGYRYKNQVTGNPERFSGMEIIYRATVKIYQLAYAGGLIR